MATIPTSHWRRLWCWVTSGSLTKEEIAKVLCTKDVLEQLLSGLSLYKPCKKGSFEKLQASQPDQTKLMNVVQTLQHYMDVDCMQIWEILKHYLCDISYGSPSNALKNVGIVDTRPSFLLPNIWKFYYAERLFVLKLLQYIIENKDNKSHEYNEQFKKVVKDIDLKKLKISLINQFEMVLISVPPSRKIQTEFTSDTVRQEWAESMLREQLFILQNILLVSIDCPLTVDEFKSLFTLFTKHGFGKKQGFNDLLEERHRELCLTITYMEISLFLLVNNGAKIENLNSWINCLKETVESELTKLQVSEEHSALLMSWMMLTLQSPSHQKLFESQYQQFGATALRMRVFEFLHRMMSSAVFNDNSKCALIVKQRVFTLLNELCDKFDGDGTLGQQNGVMQLCSLLLSTEELASEFWMLHGKEEGFGVVSLWNTALEYFPYEYSMLSILAGGLAEGGKNSVRCLIAELKNLPVYTEIFKPNHVHIASLTSEEAVVGREYLPLDDPTFKIEPGSTAVIVEKKDTTLIHFRTPISYWTIVNQEIAKALDRRGYQQNLNETLKKVYEGTKVLKGVLKNLDSEVPKGLMATSEGVFDVLTRFMGTESTPLPLLVESLEVCTALIPMFAKEIHGRLSNTGFLPRVINLHLTPEQYASGTSFDSAAVGMYLVNVEQPAGKYDLLGAYLELLCAFHETTQEDRIISELMLPGTILILREVFPNISSWRYANSSQRRSLVCRCVRLLTAALIPSTGKGKAAVILRNTCLYGLVHSDNAMQLLNIISLGNEQLERMMYDESNWIAGSGSQYISTIQRAVAIVMLILNLKSSAIETKEPTALEHLIFTQNKQKDVLKVVPRVSSYINHVFNKNFAVLCCRLLTRFSESFQMSLFSSLDMTAYQVRVMFLERLRDEYESPELKVAILEFVATCVGKQPGLTEAFFKMNHAKVESESPSQTEVKEVKPLDDGSEGILGYMADYLGTVKTDSKYLRSPLLSCMMALFHALWKNNMQILIKDLMVNPKFWDYLTSPLFNNVQPGLKTYAQIFNVLGIELFVSREKIDPNLKEMLEKLFDTNQTHLDKWISYIFTFHSRGTESEDDKPPTWLGLLTSWKDFTTICCKCLPFSLNIAHKGKMVAPCLTALLQEIGDLKDGRLVVILAELYVIMLANWKDDCFENRKVNAKQIDQLLTSAAVIYDSLHPRAKRAILSIGTVAISSLDYEIKANTVLAHSIIQSVTNINTFELEQLFTIGNESVNIKPNGITKEEIPPIVLSLAMLEQCLELYDDMFSGLSQWFQTTHFTNKLLFCLQNGLQHRRQYHVSLAALRCLTAYSRSAFSRNLLTSDVDQFLWMQLLPPKFEVNSGGWKPEEWWKIYGYSLDFISMMVMKHGAYFVSTAVTFVGVHLEHLVEAILLPRHVVSIESLNLCASTLNLFVQLVKFEERWRIENINSLTTIMRSISACLHQCVEYMVRTRRPAELNSPPDESHNQLLHRTLEMVHMSCYCLVGLGPPLLTLLAETTAPAPQVDAPPPPPLATLHATAIIIKTLNHSFHMEENSGGGGGGSRSPRAGGVVTGSGGRRRCSCGSPGDTLRGTRADSLTSLSSGTSAAHWLAMDERLLTGTLASTLTLLAQQAFMAIRDPSIPSRKKQLIRRELSSELTIYHDFVRKRIICAAHARPELVRNKLGVWPLAPDENEMAMLEEARRRRDPCEAMDDDALPPPPPPKRASNDSMREYILRKHYMDKFAQTPTKEPPLPVSHSTPTSDKKKEASRISKRVSWAETTQNSSDDSDITLEVSEPVYSNLTDVQINSDEDYFHFMSVVFLYICQTD